MIGSASWYKLGNIGSGVFKASPVILKNMAMTKYDSTFNSWQKFVIYENGFSYIFISSSDCLCKILYTEF